MADEELYAALRNADAAGDTEGAKKIASYIQSRQSAPKADTTSMSSGRAQLEAIQPSYKPPADAPPEKSGGLLDMITGPADAALSIGKNLVGTLVGSVAGVGKSLIGGNFGTDAGVEQGAKTAEDVRKAIVGAGPITKTGGKILGAVGDVVDATKIAGINPSTALNTLTPGAARVATKLSALDAAADTERAAIASLAKPAADGVKAARDVGYILTPTEMKAGLLARSVEGAAGSPRLQKAVSAKNIEVTNDLIRKDIGLAKDVPLTSESLSSQLDKLSPAYEKAKGLGQLAIDEQYKPSALSPKIDKFDNGSKWLNPVEQQFMAAPDAVEAIKSLRAEARDLYKSYKVNPHPDTLKAADARMAEAGNLEGLLDRNAKMRGQPELLSELRDARTQYAKIYLADKALNDSTGNINAGVYARELDKAKLGQTPLTGGALQVAKFAQQFPKLAQRAERIGNTDMSFGDLGMAAVKSGAGGGVAESILSLGARPTARAILQTKPIQSLMMPKADTGSSLRRSLTTLADLQGQSPITLAEISAERRHDR